MYLIAFKQLFFILLCGQMLKFARSSEFVPLMLWSNAKGMSCSNATLHQPGTTVHQLFTQDFEQCLTNIKPQEIVIFVFDELCVDDITKYASGKYQGFANIRKNMDSSKISLSSPSVEPSNLVGDITARLRKMFHDSDVKVVVLPDVDRSTDESTARCFQKNDHVIQKTLNDLDGNYIAAVTAEKTVSNAGFQKRSASGRHLLAFTEAVQNTTYLVGKCVFMTFKSVRIYEGGNMTELSTDTTGFNEETCGNASAANATNIIKKNFNVTTKNSSLSNVAIAMEFALEFFPVSARRWWYLKSVTVNYTHAINGAMSRTLTNRTFANTVYAPRQWSWVCAAPSNMTYYANLTKALLSLEFQNLQIQPFNSNFTNATFADAVDCSGWFTGAIWTGIFVGLIILFVMTYGLSMIAQVTTMDRFDDPKGKPIMVPQVDGN